jgi:DNA-binding CsgD family transcriptional regulator/ADP-ribose pyrophosphatase YjhB (NUDIX family)/predicted ABC-type ATPase
MDDSAEMQNIEEKVIFGARVVNPSDPDVFDNADSARVRARQIGCIGIRRYNNRNGTASWMPCTNESDYRRVSGIGHSGRRFRRQQLEREVREIIGSRGGRKFNSKSANYTKPELRETLKKRIMAGSKGGNPGQWSARKAQLLALAYRKAGGGYKGGKTKKQRSLSKWTKQKWRTSDGKPARRGGVTRRYLPATAWNKLTVGQRAATNRKKIQGSRDGNQFVANTEAARNARKRVTRGQKHIEFYEDFEFKAVGPRIGKITRGRNFGSATGGRAARRIGSKLRGAFAVFDPNAVDADADNVVQEGTIQERRVGPRIAEATRRATRAAADSLGRIRRKPQIDETRAFGRAERLADGRYATTLPEGVARIKPSPRAVRRGAAPVRRVIEGKPQQPRQPKRQVAEPTARAAMRGLELQPQIYPEKYEQDALRSIRDGRSEIYRQFATGESTVAELADKFDVVRDEIQQAINSHKKFRSSNRRKFANRNPRLMKAMERFSNSRTAFMEAMSEGKFRDWDSMVQYVFRNPDSMKNRDNMVNDLFDTFKTGKNPDGQSNISLGYVPSRRADDKRLVKTFSDSRKPRPDFRSMTEFEAQPKRTAAATEFAQRTPRSYRRDDLIAEAMSGGYSGITGKMSSPMTPKEEQEWKRREWKRQQLKNLSVDPNAATKFPSLNAMLAGREITKAIEALDTLDDAQLDNLWTATVGDISSVPGMTVPAYQARNAPLSPRELALAATVKRPLVKAFMDEYKKFNPTGIIANMDVDGMSDADIQSFFNTFILPELTNTGSPSVQDVEQAAQLLPTQARISDAERLLATIPSSFQTLEYRMKVAKKVLSEAGYDVDDPGFDDALQKFLEESEQKELDRFNEQLATWMNGGKPTKPPLKFAINPETGEPYTKKELEDQMDAIQEAIEILDEKLDPEIMQEMQAISGINGILSEAAANEDFLNDPLKLPDEDKLPINSATGKPYTLREWIESGAFKLYQMYINPATGKKFTREELDEARENLALQYDELMNKVGPAVMADRDKLEQFAQKLLRAYKEAGFADEDDEPEVPGDDEEVGDEDGGSVLPDPPTIEEIQEQNQEVLNDSAARLSYRPDSAVEFTKDDVKNIRRTMEGVKQTREPSSAAPDTDDYWEKFGPYDGDPNHPLNKVTDDEGNPVGLDSPEYQVDGPLWNEYLASHYAQEWSDIHNSHTIGRYTDVPEELAKYQGDFTEGVDPAQIDPNIRWDKLIEVLQQTNPELFRRDPKTGEIIGETLDTLAQQLGLRGYGGASFSGRAGQVVGPGGEVIDTSGPQYRRLLGELAREERLKQEEQYLAQTAAGAKQRAKLWNLFETGTLTPEEIAFQEDIRDINTVVSALHMHEVDNNISSVSRKNLDGVARTAFQSRQAAFDKARTKKLVDGIRELAKLASGGTTSSRATANDLKRVVDAAITHLDKTIEKIGIEYDQFRRTKQMLHGMISSLLKTRPGLFEANPNNPNARNRFGQTGWNRAKEPLLRYLNRVYKWDEEMFGFTDRRTGERKRGLLQILVDYEQSIALQTGDPAGSSATTAVFQRAQARKQELQRFKGELDSLSREAQSQGITGFMKGAGALGRAEDSARRGARKAAAGRFGFSDPRILKRYDRSGFDVSKQMLGNSSGFNRRFSNEIAEAIRNNNQSIENSPAFARLNQNEKSYLRLLEAVNNTQRRFGTEEIPTRARQISGRVGQTGRNQSVRTQRFVAPYVSKKPIEFYKSGITGRMAGTNRNERIKNFGGKDKLNLGGLIEVVPEQLEDEKWYIVNRHGEIMSPESYNSADAALKASRVLGQKLREQKRGQELPQNTAEYEAARLGLRQSGYRAASVHRQNVADVTPINAKGEKNAYIFAVDKRPKQRAGDSLIVRRNPSTGALEALVIERGFGPHRRDGEGTVALPGGFFSPEKDADLFETALREALEETGLQKEDIVSTTKLGTIDSVDWDPRFADGAEVSAMLVEVPSTWEPTAGDDAESARFVPLTEIANGNVPLGFGHAAWFEAAFAAHEDPELADLGSKFSHLNWLARQRQQRIIREVNAVREQYNAERLSRDITLFDQDNPALKLFPRELPDARYAGWVPTGKEYDELSRPRIARIIKNAHAQLDAMADADRARRGLPPKRTARNPKGERRGFPEIPGGAVSGQMRAALVEMGPDEFDKVRRNANGRDNPAAARFIEDVVNLRLTGMDKYSIAKFLSDKSALEFAVRDYGASPEPAELVRGKNTKPNVGNELAGLAPTDELVYRLIVDRKLSIAGKNRGRANQNIAGVPVQDKFTKQRNSASKDIMTMALEGLSTSEIADVLDISPERVGMTLRRMGMQDKDGSTVVGELKDVISRYENSPVQKAAYIDSLYNRLSIGEIAKKYDMPESEVRETIERYRSSVEALEPEHHSVYRKALADAEPEMLTRDEEQIVRMRLDGLTIGDISDTMKVDAGRVKTLEQRALYKLRRDSDFDFNGVKRDLDVIRYRMNPSMQYMVGDSFDLETDGVYFAARDMRDFRNNDKDIYMMNQHMGSSIKDVAARMRMKPNDIEAAIERYSSAIDTTDNFKHKALRRVLATNTAGLSGVDLDLANMRLDGASIEDVARYFEVSPESVRAKQMAIMTKLNNANGISGSMKGVANLDSRNLYNELGVPEDATQSVIDDAFTSEVEGLWGRASRKDPSAMYKLMQISDAYKVLSSPSWRESYDDFDFSNDDDVADLPELRKLYDVWPFAQYREPSTNKLRPPYVGDAVLGKGNRGFDSFVKMPHQLGSDEIIDDIDDGFLGFGENDSSRGLDISDMYYRRPVPGTKEWDMQKREADRARASGDGRFIFDENGFVVGKNLSYDPRFDNPMDPNYIGDRYGGPPKGTRLDQPMIAGRMGSESKKKFSKRLPESLSESSTRYPGNSRPSEKDMTLIKTASDRLRSTEILPVAEVFDFEFSGPDGERYESGILTIAQRPVVVVRFYDDINVPFYISSGRGGKKDVAAGKWYPFWGIGKDGWFNKTSGDDINNFYGIPELREAAERLNQILPAGSLPDASVKWNNGDTKWRASSEERRKLRQSPNYFPIKSSLIPVINGKREAVARSGSLQQLSTNIVGARKQFNKLRNDYVITGKMSTPPVSSPRKGASLPPLDTTLSDRIGFTPPTVAHDEKLWDSINTHKPAKPADGIDVPTTFGGGKISVTQDRFFDLYTKVAVGMSNAVTTGRKPGEPKRFVSVGGAPGSGKSTMRKTGEANIPGVDLAVHVDADEIKTIIPEAVAAHAAGDTEWATVVHEESRVISDMALRVALEQDKDIVYDSTGQYNRGFGTLQAAKDAGYEIVAHYVVAPESVLEDRIDERQKTDPRKLSKHIISATIGRNFSIIPDVAKMADEFYLWGWDGDSKVLFARKQKGGTVEILDTRAFAHANFFNDHSDNQLLDRPDLSQFPDIRPRRYASKQLYQVHQMFADGKTVSEIAEETKMTKRAIFDTLTKDDILSIPYEEPPVPKTLPKSTIGRPASDYEYSDEYYYDESTGGYYNPFQSDDEPNPFWFDDQEMNPVPGDIESPLTEIAMADPWMTNVLENAEQSKPYRDIVSKYLAGDIDDMELADALSGFGLDNQFDYIKANAFDIAEVFPFDDEKLEPMTDDEITQFAQDELGDAITQQTEDVFAEMSATGIKPTDALGRAWAYNYGIPMNFMKSAFSKYNRKGTIAGKMDSNNPFGDMSKTLDDLDEELQEYLQDDDLFGQTIKHPLLFWIGPVAPNMIDYINKGIEAKRETLDKALKAKNWSSYIYTHERPYRIDAFEEVMDEMTDEQYWENLSSIWVDSESIGMEAERWKGLLQSNRGSRESFMNADEREEFATLPERFTVYRGYSRGDNEELGMSWSTDRNVAEWFARRFSNDRRDIIVEELEVSKDEVFAYITRRGEAEIILDMRDAKKKLAKRTKLEPKKRGQ